MNVGTCNVSAPGVEYSGVYRICNLGVDHCEPLEIVVSEVFTENAVRTSIEQAPYDDQTSCACVARRNDSRPTGTRRVSEPQVVNDHHRILKACVTGNE